MGTPAGFDAHDAFGSQGVVACQELGILLRIDVVSDGRHVVDACHQLAQTLGQRGFSGSYRTADPNSQWAVGAHDLNNLVYCVS